MTRACFAQRARKLTRALACVVVLGACAKTADEPAALTPDTAAAEWLAKARQAHDLADAALREKHPDDARAALLAALDPEPPQQLRAEDARVVRQDLCFHVAQVELADADPSAALGFAGRGLGYGKLDDVFTANLLVVRGRALQALSRPAEAASSYQAALQINERLLRAALAGDAGPR
jgi:hypothetical protein